MFGESVRALIATLLSAHPPIGCIIDCSSWHGRVATQNTILFQTHDGKGFTNLFEYGANTDPSSPRYGFKSNLNYQAYEYEMLAEYKFFVRGSQTAPLTRVRITANCWASLRPKIATSGRNPANSLVTTVATPEK